MTWLRRPLRDLTLSGFLLAVLLCIPTTVHAQSLPARLSIRAESASPAGDTIPQIAGTIVPLLALTLSVAGDEDIRVDLLQFIILGADTAAQLLLIADEDRDRQVDAGERVLARQRMHLAGMRLDLAMIPDGLIAPQQDSLQALLAVEMSGHSPNYGFFQATFIGAETRAVGLVSGAENQFGDVGPTTSDAFLTTVLQPDQVFSLSENPVRSPQVSFNFATAPRTAAIYTASGRRVLDIMQHINWDGSFVWNLRNTAGDRVASGVYLVVFDVGGRVFREKLFVLGIAR